MTTVSGVSRSVIRDEHILIIVKHQKSCFITGLFTRRTTPTDDEPGVLTCAAPAVRCPLCDARAATDDNDHGPHRCAWSLECLAALLYLV